MKIDFQGTALIFCDPHIPFQDQRVIREVELFMEELQPDMIVYPGDIGDWYGASSFDKNPERANKLQIDLSSVGALIKSPCVIKKLPFISSPSLYGMCSTSDSLSL